MVITISESNPCYKNEIVIKVIVYIGDSMQGCSISSISNGDTAVLPYAINKKQKMDRRINLNLFSMPHQAVCVVQMNTWHTWNAVKSLWPSNTIWQHRSGSTLVQVMACCMMPPSHYLNQCWLISNVVQWHLSDGNFRGNAYDISYQDVYRNWLTHSKCQTFLPGVI